MSEQDGLVELASVPDRDNLVAEVWDGGTQICEISYEDGVLSCLCFTSRSVAQAFRGPIALAEQRMRETYDIPKNTPMSFTFNTAERAFGSTTD